MPTTARLIDVSPRDGLQNEPGVITTADKAALCRLLFASGVDEVEATSFVSPKWVPQLGDAAALLGMLAPREAHESPSRPNLSVLVPNEKGMDQAIEVNRLAVAASGRRVIDKVSVFTSASETFSRKNTNASVEETLTRFVSVIAAAKREGLYVRGYVSCAIACPFEGATPADAAGRVAARLIELGVDEISLADTIGAGSLESISRMLGEARLALGSFDRVGRLPLNLHLHLRQRLLRRCATSARSGAASSRSGPRPGA